MEREKIEISLPVIVEGRYDKSKLCEVIDAQIITTDGFGIFNQKEKLALIRTISKNGVIILTDSDGAGGVIRRYLKSALPADKVYNLYIPKIEGKEKRKSAPSKEGTLGVEGMESELLYDLFKAFLAANPIEGRSEKRGGITKADFFMCGMTGSAESAGRRDQMAELFSLPHKMTPNALLGALNLLSCRDDFYINADKLWND